MKYCKIGLTAILVIFHLSGISQRERNIDSLLTVYGNSVNDSTKVNTSLEIVSHYMYKNIDSAKLYAKRELVIAKDIKYLFGQMRANHQMGIISYHNSVYDSAVYYYNNSLDIAKKLNNLKQQTRVGHSLAIVEFHQGNFEGALITNDKNLELSEQMDDSLMISVCHNLKADISERRGHFLIAQKNALKALQIIEELDLPLRKADILTKLANIELELGNYQNAIDHNLIALSIYRKYQDHIFEIGTLNDIGLIYIEAEDLEKAHTYLEEGLQEIEKFPNPANHAILLLNMGKVVAAMGEHQKAISLLIQSIKISQELNIRHDIAVAQMEIARTYNALETPKLGLPLLKQTMIYAQSDKNIDLASMVYEVRSHSFELLGDYANATKDKTRLLTLKDSILNVFKNRQIEELKIVYETEKKEAALALQQEEIKTLNEKSRADNLKKGLYASGMASALALFGLSVFGYRQRIKKNKTAREKQEEIYKQEIAHKKKELTSQTLHLVQKNTFIQELRENLENLKSSPEKFKVEFRRIVMLLKKQNASDKDWEVFKSYFSEVHNDFDQKLKTLYPDISEKEIRLSAFLRMNLTTKEIAATLNVLPDSILKSKYRLKKKLELDKETDLNQFLNTL
ncbi:MAG: tetratricopeptide repeat protein [Flavobacteriaceae bacterium]